MSEAPLLEVENITLRFGGVTAIRDVSFSVNEGDVLSLLVDRESTPSGAVNIVPSECFLDLLYLGEGNGRFRDVTAEALPQGLPAGFTLGG